MPFFESLTKEQIQSRIELAFGHLKACDLCPRQCGVNRLEGKGGFCKADHRLKVNSIFPHHGEEPVLSGTAGSGTIFFSHCTLRCVFCQNYQISQLGHGDFMTEEELASEMIKLQDGGCHNINLVTPTHFIPQIIKTLSLAIQGGLRIPIVYNSSGYDSVEALQLMDGFVDVYLPDIKYADPVSAAELSSCPNYVLGNRAALREMWRQVGPLVTDSSGLAIQGLIVRHLVLPENRAGSEDCLAWIGRELGKDAAISLMAQYSPLHRAAEVSAINRRITREEYFCAVESLDSAGLSEGWIQEWEGMDGRFIIDFLRRKRERLE